MSGFTSTEKVHSSIGRKVFMFIGAVPLHRRAARSLFGIQRRLVRMKSGGKIGAGCAMACLSSGVANREVISGWLKRKSPVTGISSPDEANIIGIFFGSSAERG